MFHDRPTHFRVLFEAGGGFFTAGFFTGDFFTGAALLAGEVVGNGGTARMPAGATGASTAIGVAGPGGPVTREVTLGTTVTEIGLTVVAGPTAGAWVAPQAPRAKDARTAPAATAVRQVLKFTV